jgi:soluble lytic murein transglycosylase-like protein
MFRASSFTRFARVALAVPALAGLVAGCSMAGIPAFKPAAPQQLAAAAPVPAARPEGEEPFLPLAFAEAPKRTPSSVDGLIDKYAALYGVPAQLIHRVVRRESMYNPGARNGPYYGLMQIRHDTARSMGYKGSAAGLLDADTNLKYAVKYLRGAYIVGGYNSDSAVRFYARGYYYDAKRLGLLEETGLR